MDINTAIIINDQYNNTLAAIEALREQLNDVDVDAVVLLANLAADLDTLEDKIHQNKHTLKNGIQL